MAGRAGVSEAVRALLVSGKDTSLSRKRAKRKRVPNNSFLQVAETQIAGVLEKVGRGVEWNEETILQEAPPGRWGGW